jgi:hypothetical protein
MWPLSAASAFINHRTIAVINAVTGRFSAEPIFFIALTLRMEI